MSSDEVSEEGRVQGQAPARGRSIRSVVLGWTDPESGDEIVIDVRASAGRNGVTGLRELAGPEQIAGLEGIEEQGFVVLRDDGTGGSTGWGRRASVVAVRRMAMGASDHSEPRRSATRPTGS